MKKIFFSLSIAAALLCVLFQAGCATAPDPKTVYHDAVQKAITKDWDQYRFALEARDSDWKSIPEPSSYLGSQCMEGDAFERYTIDDFHYPMITKAFFCPKEKQYWVNQFGGYSPSANRWYGPFEFDLADKIKEKAFGTSPIGK